MKRTSELRLFLLSVLVLSSNCYSYFNLQNKTNIEKVDLLQKEKKTIALIGFNDYEYIFRYFIPVIPRNEIVRELLRPKWGYRAGKRVAAFSRSNKYLIKLFGIGKDLTENTGKEEYSKQIDYYKLANYKFIQKEFSEKTLQLDMLYDLIFKSKHLKIQKDEIDYYIVAINYYPFQTSTALGWISMTFSFLPSFITFNLIPFVDHQKSYTKFLIYGKNLELLDELELSNSYFVFHSVWKDENHPCSIYNRDVLLGFRPQPTCIWERNMEEGRGFVQEFLKEELMEGGH
ncbi:hypothetical protein CH370_18630 [Leptospira kmetyi]|uniref:Lp29 family lipoprotein n=1 Tax=Leptospira kmetyi TaxID=408139 RepID=UPI000C2AD1C2|nr:hypothetical protein [Leptospira kmetyi]PJZ39948.1 hypothetical protein CH370_18630 [Leptospira kmetyi]